MSEQLMLSERRIISVYTTKQGIHATDEEVKSIEYSKNTEYGDIVVTYHNGTSMDFYKRHILGVCYTKTT